MKPPNCIVLGLGLGDEGKGGICDYLCSQHVAGTGPPPLVVRFNGGVNAGHTVITDDGREHIFAQFGSGTLQGAGTFLSRFCVVDPLAILGEAAGLAKIGVVRPLDRIVVDPDALMLTPYHAAACKAREEARGEARHGSTGFGIGEAVAYALADPAAAPRIGDCEGLGLTAKLMRLRGHLEGELGPLDAPPVADAREAFALFGREVRFSRPGWLADQLAGRQGIFEGAQGVLLDQDAGFHPYTTWSRCTFANAETLLAECGQSAVRMGVTRTYLTRHGPGPFPTEDMSLRFPEPHNVTGPWQGRFRQGHLDLVLLRYAAGVLGGVDEVAVTHMDTAQGAGLRACLAYDIGGERHERLPLPAGFFTGREQLRDVENAEPRYAHAPEDWAALIGETLGAPVTVTSWGARASDKRTAVRA